MSIAHFVPGSELFRRKLSVTAFNDGYDKFFITITIDDNIFRTYSVNEQFEMTIQQIHKILSFFDQYYIVSEIQPNTSNLHYHIMGVMNKHGGYLTTYKKQYIDAPDESDLYYFINRRIRDRIETHGKFTVAGQLVTAIHSKTPFTDVKTLSPTQDFISYLHKDLDNLYGMTKYEKVRFIIKAPVDELKGLNKLINFKKT